MTTDTLLSTKQEELVAVGASIAAGCQPCTRFHFRTAQAAGATAEEIRRAIHDALVVRSEATQVMAALAGQFFPETQPAPDADLRAANSMTDQLVALGAAVAANCATTVETSAIAVWRAGASESQIAAVVKIARAVREMAGKKTEAVLSKLAEASAGCAGDCACRDDSGQLVSGSTEKCCGGRDPGQS